MNQPLFNPLPRRLIRTAMVVELLHDQSVLEYCRSSICLFTMLFLRLLHVVTLKSIKKKIKEMNECNPQTHLTEFETQFRVCTARSEEKTLFYCYPSYKVFEKGLLNQMRSLGARLCSIQPRIAVTSTYLVCGHHRVHCSTLIPL